MKRNGWSQKECERLIRHYIDKTNKLDYHPRDIAKWAQANGYTMPKPATDVDLLTILLQQASVKSRRRDETAAIQYRANLAYPVRVEGEWRMQWCDADGPTIDANKVLASAHHRKEQAINILASALATITHFNRTHPKAQMDMFDLGITNEEVQWRLYGRRAAEGDDEQQSVG